VLVVGYCLSGDGPAALSQTQATQPPGGPTDSAYFESLKKQADEQQKKADELYRKLRAAAQPHIDAQAKARGGTEPARQQLGPTLAEINARLKPGGQPLPPGTPGYRVEPGMRVDVIMKEGTNEYTGALVGCDGTTVLLQTIPLEGAKPSEFDLSKIAAFHTSFGIFAYNPKTGRIVPALTSFRLKPSTGQFERMASGSGDAFLGVDAKVLGPVNSAWASLDIGADGSWVVALPIPFYDSPDAIPAADLRQFITSEGVYTYDPQAKNYKYESHATIVAAAQKKEDAAGQAYYKKQWDRSVQEYKLGTSRVQAMQPTFTSPWAAVPPAPWYRSGAAPPTRQ